MKKILSILAAIGLTATTGATVVACGNSSKQVKDQVDVKVAPTIVPAVLKETQPNEIITGADIESTSKTIIASLTKLNKDVVIHDDTFVVNLKGVTPKSEFVSVKVNETKSTADQSGLKTSTIKVPIKFTDEKTVLEAITKVASNPHGLIIDGHNDGQDIDFDDLEPKLIEQLTEFQDLLTFKQVGEIRAIKVNQDKIEKGQITLNIFLNNELLKDNDQDEFIFSFINQTYAEPSNVLERLNEGSIVNLSDFKINLGDKETTIGGLVNILGLLIKGGNYIPDQIPEKFDNTDANWKQWTNSLSTIKEILKATADIDIDEPIIIEKSIEDIPVINKLDLNVETKISDILNSILPDLIHFRNFMLEQRAENQNDNLILLLIQYLFDNPNRNIKDDGFDQVNQTSPDLKNKGEYLTFNTNLERLVHDLLLGWQTIDGTWWKAKDSEGNEKEAPISIVVKFKVLVTIEISIKYQSNGIKTAGLLDILPIESIKSLITQLLDWNLNEPIKLTIDAPVIGKKEIEINALGDAIKSSIFNILDTDAELTGQLDNLDLQWKSGKLKIEVLNKDGKWDFANDFDDVLSARDIRVKFVENNWLIKVKDTDEKFEIENGELTLNLDLKASAIC